MTIREHLFLRTERTTEVPRECEKSKIIKLIPYGSTSRKLPKIVFIFINGDK